MWSMPCTSYWFARMCVLNMPVQMTTLAVLGLADKTWERLFPCMWQHVLFEITDKVPQFPTHGTHVLVTQMHGILAPFCLRLALWFITWSYAPTYRLKAERTALFYMSVYVYSFNISCVHDVDIWDHLLNSTHNSCNNCFWCNKCHQYVPWSRSQSNPPPNSYRIMGLR